MLYTIVYYLHTHKNPTYVDHLKNTTFKDLRDYGLFKHYPLPKKTHSLTQLRVVSFETPSRSIKQPIYLENKQTAKGSRCPLLAGSEAGVDFLVNLILRELGRRCVVFVPLGKHLIILQARVIRRDPHCPGVWTGRRKGSRYMTVNTCLNRG